MNHILIVGAGAMGERHLRAFQRTGRARISLCEPEDERRERVASDCGIEQTFKDIQAVDLGDFDAAVICAPPNLHIPIGQVCADAGVSFLMEKPLAVTREGVDRLIRTVDDKRLVARVGYLRRCMEGMGRLREALDGGRIGKVLTAQVVTGQDFRKYRPDYAHFYYAREATGGGAILDAASHFIDLLLWTMGPIREVSALGDRLDFEGVECEDTVLMQFRFERGGALGQVTLNQFQKPNVSTMEFAGTEGNLRWDEIGGMLDYAADDSGRWQREDIYGGRPVNEVMSERFLLQAGAFLDALDGAPDRLATLKDAADNLDVCLAAKRSIAEKRTIEIGEVGAYE